jgi:hypothetical protein
VGCVIVFALALLLARVLVPKRTETAPAASDQP